MKEVEEALFPGYLFCRFNLNDRLPILSTPWVTSIVGIGGTPAPVDESEIASLRCIVDSGLEVQPWPFLQAGDRVRIANGPLSGLEGILVEVKKQNRLVISVTLLQRSVAVPIDRSEILPIGPPRPKEKTALLKG